MIELHSRGIIYKWHRITLNRRFSVDLMLETILLEEKGYLERCETYSRGLVEDPNILLPGVLFRND